MPQTIIIIFSLCLIVHSQQASTVPQEGKSFTAMAVSALSERQLYYRKGRKFIPLQLNARTRSQSYSLTGVKKLSIYTDSAGSKPPYTLLTEQPLVEGADQMLFFFSEQQTEGSAKLRLLGIDDSFDAFPTNSFRVINFVSKLVHVTLGSETYRLKPGIPLIHSSGVAGSSGYSIPFLLKDMEGETISGTRLFTHSRTRETVLIFPTKDKVRILHLSN